MTGNVAEPAGAGGLVREPRHRFVQWNLTFSIY
ncbi:hypothetical protein HNQ78_001844 [Phycisphaera mikurensis]|nr:hypothetical protein [Phycisphaera mikurensis]